MCLLDGAVPMSRTSINDINLRRGVSIMIVLPERRLSAPWFSVIKYGNGQYGAKSENIVSPSPFI